MCMLKHFQPKATAKVLVVGDVILDRYIYGETNRISPEAPVPVVRVMAMEERPGGAANVAVNIRALGVPVSVLGITGDDDTAQTLSKRLQDADVAGHFLFQSDYLTVTKLRVLSQHQQLLRLDYENHSGEIDSSGLVSMYVDILNGMDVVVLSDYAKGSLRTIDEFIKEARDRNIPVLIDPKGRDFTRYAGATLLTPNLKEFEAVVGSCRNDMEIEEKGRELCRTLSIETILVTRGERGMSLISAQNNETTHLAARTHEIFDVTGAGDTVIAATAAGLASGYSLLDSIHYANLAAGLVVGKLGAATVSVDELNHVIEPANFNLKKVYGDKEITSIVEQARNKGEKIVMTNGCFDLLHAGHVDYLQQARALGDRLLVAVNDDESVQKLKGKGRPINRLDQRVTVLAGLSAVDWIVPFTGETPEVVIEKVKPDFLVKGGDYQPEQIAGAKLVESIGGKVVIVPYRDGCSSSRVIETIIANAKED